MGMTLNEVSTGQRFVFIDGDLKVRFIMGTLQGINPINVYTSLNSGRTQKVSKHNRDRIVEVTI